MLHSAANWDRQEQLDLMSGIPIEAGPHSTSPLYSGFVFTGLSYYQFDLIPLNSLLFYCSVILNLICIHFDELHFNLFHLVWYFLVLLGWLLFRCFLIIFLKQEANQQ